MINTALFNKFIEILIFFFFSFKPCKFLQKPGLKSSDENK